jgi:hypothetical protein
MCGVAAGDPDPLGGSRTVRLTMGHIKDKSKGGDDSPQNLRAVCTNCNEGLQNTALPKPDKVHLLSQVRRVPSLLSSNILGAIIRFNMNGCLANCGHNAHVRPCNTQEIGEITRFVCAVLEHKNFWILDTKYKINHRVQQHFWPKQYAMNLFPVS